MGQKTVSIHQHNPRNTGPHQHCLCTEKERNPHYQRGNLVKLCQVYRSRSSPGSVKHLASHDLVVFWVVLYVLSVISYVKHTCMYVTLLQALEVGLVCKFTNFCDSLQNRLTLFAYKLIYF